MMETHEHLPRNNDPPQLWWPDNREAIPPEVWQTWPNEKSVPDMIEFHQRQGVGLDAAQALRDINALRQSRYEWWLAEQSEDKEI